MTKKEREKEKHSRWAWHETKDGHGEKQLNTKCGVKPVTPWTFFFSLGLETLFGLIYTSLTAVLSTQPQSLCEQVLPFVHVPAGLLGLSEDTCI